MNARNVVGKRIVRIVQQRDVSAAGTSYDNLHAIVLDDKTEIRFVVVEHEGDYGVRGVIANPSRKVSK